MPSPFAALEDAMSEAVDEQFAEAFEYRPYTAGPGGGRGGPDASRPLMAIRGVFFDKSYNSKAFGDEERTATRMTLRHATLSVDKRQLAHHDPPRRADRVKRVDTGVVYEIAEVGEDGHGRHKLRLVEILKEDP
jgi:hypothetical protein